MYNRCIISLIPAVSLILSASVSASYAPFLGCEESYAWGIAQGDDCYAVDSDVCHFLYNRQCRETTAAVTYYNGGETVVGTEPYPESIYHRVTISARLGCDGASNSQTRTCTITVDGETCNSCSNTGTDYSTVTLEDCSNIPGVFRSGSQIITLAPGGGYLELEVVAERCEHPALEGLSPPAVKTMVTQLQFQYKMSSDAGDLEKPSIEAIEKLVTEDTESYFDSLLTRVFPDILGLSTGQWESQSTGSTSTSNLFFNITMALTLEEDSTTTSRQITDFIAQTGTLNRYVRSTVWRSDPVFLPTYQVLASVIGSG